MLAPQVKVLVAVCPCLRVAVSLVVTCASALVQAVICRSLLAVVLTAEVVQSVSIVEETRTRGAVWFRLPPQTARAVPVAMCRLARALLRQARVALCR